MASDLFAPNYDRVRTVLLRQGEPDRVPFLELFHDAPIMAAIVGRPLPEDPAEHRKWRLEFQQKLGYDYVNAGHGFGFPRREGIGLVTEDTTDEKQSRGQRGWRDEHRGTIESWEDFEQYRWPRIEEASFEDLEEMEKLLPEGMMIHTTLPGGVLENLVDLIGYERLCFAVVEEPELVQAVADQVGQGEVSLFEALCDFESVGALWLNDDLGFKTQTMISPQDLRKYVFPWHKKMVEVAHAHGKPVMLHACGNLSEVYEDIIEDCKLDAKHSYEDVIQPVTEFKRQYGDRIAVLGGIDVDYLARYSEEEVRRYVRRTLEEAMPGGGYALGSGNSVANYIPVENFLAMLDEGRKVGVYH